MNILNIVFYLTTSKQEPVRQWLLEQSKKDRKDISQEIKAFEYCWSLGMCISKKIEQDLWVIIIKVSPDLVAKIFYTVKIPKISSSDLELKKTVILLHGFIEKSQIISPSDLMIANKRKNNVLS